MEARADRFLDRVCVFHGKVTTSESSGADDGLGTLPVFYQGGRADAEIEIIHASS